MRSSRGSRRRSCFNAISNAIVPCVPAVSRRALPGAVSVLVMGGLLVEAGGIAWADALPDQDAPAATQSAPLLLAQGVPPMSTSVALGETGAPVVSILQPNYADLVKGRTSIIIGVNASHVGGQTVEMFLDGASATGGPVAVPSAPTTEFKFDTTLFTDGAHRLKVKVTDAQGFIGQSETTIYINNGRKVDATPPILQWLNIRSGDWLRGDAKLRLRASDKFGVKYVFVHVTPAATPNGQAVRIFLASQPPYVFDFDTTLVPDGVYSLSARATDAMLNEGRAPATFIGIANRIINPTEFQAELDNAILSSPEAATPAPGIKTGSVRVDPKVAAPLFVPGQETNGSNSSAGAPANGTNARIVKSTIEREGAIAVTSSSAPENAMTTIPSAARPSTAGVSALYSGTPAKNALAPGLAPARIGTPTSKRRHTQSRIAATTPAAPRMSTRETPSDAMTMVLPPYALPTTRSSMRAATPTRVQHDAWLETSPDTAKRTVRNSKTVKAATSAKSTSKPAPVVARITVEAPPRAIGEDLEIMPEKRVRSSAVAIPGSPTPSVTTMHSLTSGASVKPVIEHSNVMRLSALSATPRPLEAFPPATSTETAQAQTTTGTLTALPVNSDVLMASSGGAHQAIPNYLPALPAATGGSSLPGVAVHALPEAPSNTFAQPFVAPRLTSPRVVLLPPSTSARRRQGAPAAITVAPLSSDKILPAMHIVARGETLSAIAARFKVPAAVLAASNNLKPTARLLAGTTLRLPRPLKVSFGGKPMTGDVAALMVGSTSVTPFRYLFEQQGGSLEWDAKRQQVVARNATQEITLTIGSRAAVVNRQQVMMDLAAFLLSGRTMVPVRFFEKALHAQVDWEPVSGRLYISMAPPA